MITKQVRLEHTRDGNKMKDSTSDSHLTVPVMSKTKSKYETLSGVGR